MTERFEAVGKEVLWYRGEAYTSFAQGVSVEAAVRIAAALNNFSGTVDAPCDTCKQVGGHAPTCERGRTGGNGDGQSS